ncbi:MAG: AbrB/MazE/SpoVT family DNA-binding domain-containing protein [Terriglobales bacterium]
MKARLVASGNSRGIRIPKALIEQCGLERDLELRVEGRTLVLAPRSPPRGVGGGVRGRRGGRASGSRHRSRRQNHSCCSHPNCRVAPAGGRRAGRRPAPREAAPVGRLLILPHPL